MKEVKLYSKLENFTVEYEIHQLSPSTNFDDQIIFIEHSIASVKEKQTSANEEIDLLTARLSELDCSVSVASRYNFRTNRFCICRRIHFRPRCGLGQ